MIETRLYKRSIQLELQNFKEYFYILTHFFNKEIPFLIGLCTTHTTNYFREAGHFDYLEKDILYHLMIDQELLSKTFKVWCAASSTGEEVYTLAMVIDKFYRENKLYPDFEIYATDIDVHSVQLAKTAVYANSHLKSIPVRYHNYLKNGQGKYEGFFQVDQGLQKKIKWGVQNLFSTFTENNKDVYDAIFVRNVFIYFSPAEIEDCIKRMSRVLKPERFLILGHSEHLSGMDSDFELIRDSIHKNCKSVRVIRTLEEIKKEVNIQEEKVKSKDENALRLLCIDDSKTIHTIIEKLLDDVRDVIIVGHAYDGQEGLDFLANNEKGVDVILCDINMPNIDGLQFLEQQVKVYNIPTLILSSFSKEDGGFYFKALDLGAIDYVQKPQSNNFKEVKQDILLKLRTAKKSQSIKKEVSGHQLNVKSLKLANEEVEKKIVLIGSSTGGPQALETILVNLPKTFPPVLVSQHMPDAFVSHFAERLNQMCDMEVSRAEKGTIIEAGHIYLAPGDQHLKVNRQVDQFILDYDTSGQWDGQPTSVDSLYGSATVICSEWKVVTITLTGMGKDGTEGLKKLRNYDAIYSIAQDEESSVVWGMAGSAVEEGVIDKQLPLTAIAAHLISKIKSRSK